MGGEMLAKRNRSALVKKNVHSGRFERTGSVFKHGADLFKRHAREPGDKVQDLGSVFKILEQGCDRNTGAAKHPSATHAFGIAFHSRAGRPVNHEINCRRGTEAMQF